MTQDDDQKLIYINVETAGDAMRDYNGNFIFQLLWLNNTADPPIERYLHIILYMYIYVLQTVDYKFQHETNLHGFTR